MFYISRKYDFFAFTLYPYTHCKKIQKKVVKEILDNE